MNSKILQSEFMKTRRSAVRRIAIASPLCLAVLAIVQQGYFTLNLFNWFYVVFLPATFALISAGAVNIDKGKNGLRTIRSLPIMQEKIWVAKLYIVAAYALCSCLLLSVALIVVPGVIGLLGIDQFKPLGIPTIFCGIIVMYVTSIWQVPFCFLLAKKLGLIFTVIVNLLVSFSGVLLALKPYWLFCPWAWVNRAMIAVIGVLPNGLPAESTNNIDTYDVILALMFSLILAVLLGILSTKLYAKSEAR